MAFHAKRIDAALLITLFTLAFAFALMPSMAWADEQVGASGQELADNPVSDPVASPEEAVNEQVLLSDAALEGDSVAQPADDTPGFDEADAAEEAADVAASAVEAVNDSDGENSNDGKLKKGELLEQDAEEAAEEQPIDDEQPDMGIEMHRLYNPNSGEHFYTGSVEERNTLSSIGWKYEGVGWVAPSSGTAVHRLYNPNAGDHHYTPNEQERNALVNVGWVYEGIGWYSGGDRAVLRQYNPNAVAGAHNFTMSQEENDYLVQVGWKAEGVGWYALAASRDELVSRYAVAQATVTASGKDLKVKASYVDGTYYLCLPSFADLSAVRLSALLSNEEIPVAVADWNSPDFKDVALGEAVDILSLATTTLDNGAHLISCKTSGGSFVQNLAVMVSDAISAVHVESVDSSKGRSYIEASADHSAKANVCVTVVNADGELVYDQDSVKKSSTIKGRGNTTWTSGSKKPYQISLNKKADLLETGQKDNSQKKWILLANAHDETLLHNTVAYNTALELGLAGTECIPVDLYYDGEYRGSYLLCEKIQIQKGRIDIEDLESAFEDANPDVDFETLSTDTATNKYGKTFKYVKGIANPADITGGYLLEIDDAYYESEPSWFDSSWGIIVVKSPEFCSKEAMTYISEYVERAIKQVSSGKEIADDDMLFDLDSLAKTYLINEFAKNIDAFCTSTFLYKDAGDTPLFAAPVWDFDGSMGVRLDLGNTAFASYHGFILPNATAVSNIKIVQDCARAVWEEQLSPLLKDVLLSEDVEAQGPLGYLRSLAFYRQQIEASQKMDEVLFGLASSFSWFSTYDLGFEYLQNWLNWRTAWIDDNLWRLSDGAINNAPWTYDDVDYALVFDAGYYVDQNKDTIGQLSDANAIKNFYEYGMSRGLVASRNFDVNVYKERYPDLSAAYGNDLKQYYLHYIQFGFEEGRIAI